MLLDSHNRLIDYLRISITDRCNLRCVYCMPQEGIKPLPQSEILTYEEIIRISALAMGMGIRKIRLTGGEPLVRKDVEHLIAELAELPGLEDLSMTTNGILLAPMAGRLRAAGLHRVNVSMDSMDAGRYRKLTRGGDLKRVWDGLAAALDAGMTPVKINMVPLDGQNAGEILEFARLTLKWPVEVRFIERMPLVDHPGGDAGCFVPGGRILAELHEAFPLEPASSQQGNGPARMYRITGGRGLLGIISPMTQHVCRHCNRLRLTADGKLRNCLFSDEELDLKSLMREGCSDRRIVQRLREAIRSKPKGHQIHALDDRVKKCMRPMSRIGG